jgi:dihydrofolate reductase
VIGGAEIYAQALPVASTAVVTEIAANFEGDAFAPQFGPDWIETGRQNQVSVTGLSFSFVSYCKNTGV